LPFSFCPRRKPAADRYADEVLLVTNGSTPDGSSDCLALAYASKKARTALSGVAPGSTEAEALGLGCAVGAGLPPPLSRTATSTASTTATLAAIATGSR